MRKYTGIIVEESLKDNRIVNNLEVIEVRISDEEKPEERWHLYTVKVSRKEIEKVSKNIKQGWYMHFWKGKKVIVIFKDKKFEFDFDDKKSWQPVVKYGLSLGIPKEELDFPID